MKTPSERLRAKAIRYTDEITKDETTMRLLYAAYLKGARFGFVQCVDMMGARMEETRSGGKLSVTIAAQKALVQWLMNNLP